MSLRDLGREIAADAVRARPWEVDPRFGDAWEFVVLGPPPNRLLAVFQLGHGGVGEWHWSATGTPVNFDVVRSGQLVWTARPLRGRGGA